MFQCLQAAVSTPSTQPAPLQPPPPIRMFALGGELEEGGHREQGTRRRLCRLRGVGVCRVCPNKPTFTFCKHDCIVLQVLLWPGRRLVSRHSSVPRIVRSKQTSPRPAPPRLGLPQNRLISSHQQEVGTENNPSAAQRGAAQPRCNELIYL